MSVFKVGPLAGQAWGPLADHVRQTLAARTLPGLIDRRDVRKYSQFMALSGTLQTLSVAEILQTLARSSASGVLSLDAVEIACDVVFDEGRIIQVFDRSPGSDITLTQRMVAWGAIDPAILPSSADDRGSSSWKTIQVLIGKGHADSELVAQAMADITLAQLYDLFTWEDASFTFTEVGQQAAADQLLAQARERPVPVSVDNVLMESARRLDEWGRMQAELPSDDAVFARAEGGEAVLAEVEQDYPGRSLIPLIDGIRSLEEIVLLAPVTRMDVYSTLADLVARRAIVALDLEQLCDSAGYYASIGDQYNAARLYRRALALDPGNTRLCRKLAEALESMGGSPEAAGSFRQLALAYLADDNIDAALEAADRAVELAGRHGVREREVLITCLERAGEDEEARNQMLALGDLHLELDQWHAAQRLANQLLQLDPTDVEACHLLARAIVMNDEYDCGPDEVVCITCTAVNQRNASHCTACGAPLLLPCMACGREVVVTDRVCIYCGEDPHRHSSRPRSSADADLMAGADSGVVASIRQASRLLAGGAGDQALEIWQDLAERHPSDARIKARLREVAGQVHQDHIAELIEVAQERHRARRYYRAHAAYRRILLGLDGDDPRRPRIRQLCEQVGREKRRTTIFYCLALITAAMAVGMLFYDRWRVQRFTDTSERTLVRARELAASGGARSFIELQQLRNRLSEEARVLGEDADGHWEEINEILKGARDRLIAGDLDQVEELLAAGELDAAAQRLADVERVFGPGNERQRQQALQERLGEARRLQSERAQRLSLDPGRMQEARDAARTGRSAAALAMVVDLRDSPDQQVRAEATALYEQLQEEQQAFQERLARLQEQAESDYPAAAVLAEELRQPAAAWQAGPRIEAITAAVAARREAADVAYAGLGAEPAVADLQAFLREYAGSRHADLARQRLKQGLIQEDQVVQLRRRYQRARAAEDWEAAHA
ncbi:MAG: DUF4388 domain-containing protein, partial [Planctomycetota bacterium]